MKVFNAFKFLAIFLSSSLYAQSHLVLDSITKEPISFVAVKFGENSGLYTNEKGMFSLNDKVKDSIHISCLGYFDYKEAISKLKDTIYLTPKTEVLTEVVLSTKKKDSFVIGSLKKAKNFGALIFPNSEFITYIKPAKTFVNSYIKAIHIPVVKYSYSFDKKNKFKDTKGVFRLNIYSAENEHPKQKIYSSIPINFHMDEKEIFVIDVSEEFLTLNEEGLCFGVELIGYIDENGNINDDKNGSYLRIPFTNKLTDDFESTTYYKYIFNDEDILIPKNDILKKAGIKKELYMKIGLTVSQ